MSSLCGPLYKSHEIMTNCTPIQPRVVQGIYVIKIDNPLVNAISYSVRRALILALNEFERSDGQAAVLIGANDTLITGADIREFGESLQEPVLLDAVQAIENCTKPIVAGLQRSVLGGGLELPLACDARVAHEETVIGFPEVSLGIIPGAGGSQSLLRRAGIACDDSKLQEDR
jgi:3-hydroxyacyl-CoA dehydrogenase